MDGEDAMSEYGSSVSVGRKGGFQTNNAEQIRRDVEKALTRCKLVKEKGKSFLRKGEGHTVGNPDETNQSLSRYASHSILKERVPRLSMV